MVRSRLALLPLVLAASTAASAQSPGVPAIAFELVRRAGSASSRTRAAPARHQPETMVSGVALLDYDGDGLLDVFAVNGASMPLLDKSRPGHWNRLYRNLGSWKFEDVTERAGVTGNGYDLGVAAADYDNDGRRPACARPAPEHALPQPRRRHASGRHEQAGLARPDPDYGRSGRWRPPSSTTTTTAGWTSSSRTTASGTRRPSRAAASPGTHDYCHPSNYRGLPNSLYHNNGDGTFTRRLAPVAASASAIGKGMGIGVADFDGDGFMDVFVANDTDAELPVHEQAETGRSRRSASMAGVAYTDDGRAISGMGADARDIDNDGRPDIFETAMVERDYARSSGTWAVTPSRT